MIHLQLYERTDYRCCSTFLMGQFATVTIVIDNQVNSRLTRLGGCTITL